MIQNFFMFLSTLLLCLNLTAEVSSTQSKINWMTSYEEAVNLSNSSSKPILLFFTGSDYCSWCHKLEAEVFNTQEFINSAGDKFIFVELDFPASGKVPQAIASQNQQLKKKYGVRGFPTIILVDSKGQKIGETGYKAGGGKQYAEHLFKMVNDFSGYKQKLSQLEKQNYSGQELKAFYEKAQEFGLDQDAQKIMTLGFNSDQRHFFLMERYRYLAWEGQHESKEGLTIKKQLIQQDPENVNLTAYHLAIIDFEALALNFDHSKKSAEELTKPLTNYINQYGKEDKNHLWRLHMIISQVYYDKDLPIDALKHAELSLSLAPSLVQPEIETVIKNIKHTDLSLPLANTH